MFALHWNLKLDSFQKLLLWRKYRICIVRLHYMRRNIAWCNRWHTCQTAMLDRIDHNFISVSLLHAFPVDIYCIGWGIECKPFYSRSIFWWMQYVYSEFIMAFQKEWHRRAHSTIDALFLARHVGLTLKPSSSQWSGFWGC